MSAFCDSTGEPGAPMRLPQDLKTRRAAVPLLVLLSVAGGYFIFRGAQQGIRDFESGIQRKSSEIQEEFEATISNMALEHKQYLECEQVADAWRMAQSGYHRDFGAYADEPDAMRGRNTLQKHYTDDALADAMKGVCYIIEMSASDTGYRMSFEVDKQALVQQYEKRLDREKDPRTREHLMLRVNQLRSAEPCRIRATNLEITANGQCGFAARPNEN